MTGYSGFPTAPPQASPVEQQAFPGPVVGTEAEASRSSSLDHKLRGASGREPPELLQALPEITVRMVPLQKRSGCTGAVGSSKVQRNTAASASPR